MKKIFAAAMMIILAVTVTAANAPRFAFADKNSPPDESIPESPSGESGQGESAAAREAREKKEAEEKAARAAKEAAARRERERAAAEAKRREAARRAEAAMRAEEARRAASEDMAARLLNSGVEYVERGRYQMALNTLRGYAEGNPRSADAWYWIARAHHALGDYDKAQSAVNIALEIDPYYGPLSKTPSGLEPMPPLTKQRRKEPRPSMSVLPVKQPLPSGIAIEPVTISFPYLTGASASGDAAISGDASGGAYLRYEPYPPMNPGRTPRWMASGGKFDEIGRWRFRVDRMGILKDPRVPVAWRGSRPYEVYFWTGREWARVSRSAPRESFDGILYRARDDIAEVAREGPAWDERDTPALAASASLMRYMWIGDIDLTEASRRAGRESLSGDVAEGE